MDVYNEYRIFNRNCSNFVQTEYFTPLNISICTKIIQINENKEKCMSGISIKKIFENLLLIMKRCRGRDTDPYLLINSRKGGFESMSIKPLVVLYF